MPQFLQNSRFDIYGNQIDGARDYQEDCYEIIAPQENDGSVVSKGVTCVLADGMGGHVGGAIASKIICTSFKKAIALPNDHVPTFLNKVLKLSNLSIAKHILKHAEYEGMGSTVIAIHMNEQKLHWISVGDSLLLLFRNGKLKRINKDHSLAPQIDAMVARGEMDEETAQKNPDRHVLLSAIMGDDIELIDAPEKPLTIENSDCLILASDGIETLSHSTIEDIIAKHKDRGAKSIVNNLLKAVVEKENPHQDNTTIIALTKISSDEGHHKALLEKTNAQSREAEMPIEHNRYQKNLKSSLLAVITLTIGLILGYFIGKASNNPIIDADKNGSGTADLKPVKPEVETEKTKIEPKDENITEETIIEKPSPSKPPLETPSKPSENIPTPKKNPNFIENEILKQLNEEHQER